MLIMYAVAFCGKETKALESWVARVWEHLAQTELLITFGPYVSSTVWPYKWLQTHSQQASFDLLYVLQGPNIISKLTSLPIFKNNSFGR